jgi:acetyltransferase-like isoleucine patch superfamily enzyme
MDSGLVTIGNKVLIGPNVTIVTELHEKEIMSRRSGKVFAKPVTIEDDCWIGVGTTILPGVTIGRGSVIGAGSIVTRDIPSASVAWGNPARVVELVGDANAVFAGMN